MDRMLYVAMSGARAALTGQGVAAQNLANAATTGFRAVLQEQAALPLAGDVYAARVFAIPGASRPLLVPGPIVRTGRSLDVAVDGDGWIAVQAPDGGEAYTRRGDLYLGPGGVLTTGDGHVVLGDGGPIAVPPHETVQIGADGTVTVRPLGQGANALTVLDRIRLVRPDPERLVRGPDGLFRLADGTAAPPDASVRLSVGALEQSNVSTVEVLTRVIELTRHYEMQVRLMQAAKENDESSAQLLRMG